MQTTSTQHAMTNPAATPSNEDAMELKQLGFSIFLQWAVEHLEADNKRILTDTREMGFNPGNFTPSHKSADIMGSSLNTLGVSSKSMLALCLQVGSFSVQRQNNILRENFQLMTSWLSPKMFVSNDLVQCERCHEPRWPEYMTYCQNCHRTMCLICLVQCPSCHRMLCNCDHCFPLHFDWNDECFDCQNM